MPERLAPKTAAGSHPHIKCPGPESGVSLTVVMRNERHKIWKKKFLRDLEKDLKNVAHARKKVFNQRYRRL